jgi:ParB/RepB/Spo0J family partition protein
MSTSTEAAASGPTSADAEAGAPHTAPAIADLAAKPSFGDIPLECIRVSKTNPRKIFNQDHLQDLAASIKKQGVAQPILVRPIETIGDVTYFELVAGERRYRASGIAGMATVPAVVRVLSDREAFELQVLENLQRVDLHPLEEAEGFESLMKAFNVSADELAEKVGKSRAYIYASLKLCALEAGPRKSFYDGALTKSTALLVARIPVKALQEQCVKAITTGYGGVMSFREAAAHIERNYMLHLKKAAFKPGDGALLSEAGSCTDCPKRTGNQPEIFTDVNADVCTDPICYKAKADAHVIRIKQLAKDNGVPVLSGAEAKKVMPSNYSADLKGGYVAVDRKVYSDEKQRSYRQMLGKDLPPTTLLQSPYDDTEIIHVVKLADIAPALKGKGIETPAGGQDNAGRDREKEQEAKAKLEREYRKRLFLATHHASLMMNLVDLDLRLVARQMFENLPWGMIPTKLVIELYGWTDNMFGSPRRQNIEAAINGLTPAQLNQFIRDCALCRELDVSIYTAPENYKPQNLLDFAARAKVDAKKIRAGVDGEAKAKADAKKKAADKKAAKAAPASVAQPVKQVAPLIDVTAMQYADLVSFIQANPDRIDELTKTVLNHSCGELIGPLEKAANSLGYIYTNGGFQLVLPAVPAVEPPALDAVADSPASDDVDAAAVAGAVEETPAAADKTAAPAADTTPAAKPSSKKAKPAAKAAPKKAAAKPAAPAKKPATPLKPALAASAAPKRPADAWPFPKSSAGKREAAADEKPAEVAQ